MKVVEMSALKGQNRKNLPLKEALFPHCFAVKYRFFPGECLLPQTLRKNQSVLHLPFSICPLKEICETCVMILDKFTPMLKRWLGIFHYSG